MSDITAGAKLAWDAGARETAKHKHPYIEPEHLLLGLIGLQRNVEELGEALKLTSSAKRESLVEFDGIKAVFASSNADLSSYESALRRQLKPGTTERRAGPVSRSPETKTVFARAEELAGAAPLAAMHLLRAVLECSTPALMAAEKASGASPGALSWAAASSAPDPSSFAAPAGKKAPLGRLARADARAEDAGKSDGAESFGRDLTKLAAEGKLGPYIGRRDELLRCIQTLARSSKNNPILVGEAGVGKTAVVEALAVRVAAGKDKVLSGKRIVEVSMGALVAGTKFRGEFEQRLQALITESKRDPNLIIFIDEIHTIMGAGDGEGATDAANLLKPALSRGELRCIGATTIDEYRRHIEKDPALERRFERIDIPEPSREETLAILKGLRAKWEKHHGSSYSDEALAAAVNLSVRFDPDRQLPDKAIDLVDLAGARSQVPALSLWKPSSSETAAPSPAPSRPVVDARAVAAVLAERRKLPLELILASAEGLSANRLSGLEAALNARVLGQTDAAARVAKRLTLAHAGLSERRGPLGVFLFLGPSGVGKTEMAKALADALFGGADEIIRLDMSEYMEKHSVARLIGSPPGYVGHEQEGQLVKALRTKPYSVVLLDEMEKADPQVLDAFLQVFDEGRLTDSRGRTADARHAVFVMTSNLGFSTASAAIGFASGPAAPAAGKAPDFAGRLRPEFVNRIDEIVVFKPLPREVVSRVLDAQFAAAAGLLKAERGAELILEPAARELIVAAGFSEEFGARELRRALERLVMAPLAALLAEGKVAKGSKWRVVAENGAVVLKA